MLIYIPVNSAIVVELIVVSSVLATILTIGHVSYNAFLHPLRSYPGPLSHRMTIIPRAFYQFRGILPFHVSELHRRYGPVVRIAPNELAFSSPQAWRDIYGTKPGQEEFAKYEGFYRVFKHLPVSIGNADYFEHARLRRHLSPGFSPRKMRAQEPIIGSYVDLLISRLKEAVQTESTQDMLEWYTWTTFDIIGDLSFGVEGGFGCLSNNSYHPWAGQRLADGQHRHIVKEKVSQRLNSEARPDFLDSLIRNKESLNLDLGRLATTASALIIAGSETTASLLCGVTYLLTVNTDILHKVQREVRSAFKSSEEITLMSVGKLEFMLACLNEALRCYPPVPTGFPRQTHREAVIDGKYVPKGTVVSVFQYAINYDARYWKEPHRFIPERWMCDPRYEGDQLDAMQPFSLGPRNCIGQNLAYAEMRLILARILYNFDLTLADESRDWTKSQKAWTVWDKPALGIRLHPLKS